MKTGGRWVPYRYLYLAPDNKNVPVGTVMEQYLLNSCSYCTYHISEHYLVLKMPRKQAFSGKAKKAQLMAKRDRVQGTVPYLPYLLFYTRKYFQFH